MGHPPTEAARKRTDDALNGSPRPAPLPRWLRHALRLFLQFSLDAAAVAVSYRLAYELRFHAGPLLRAFPLHGIDPGWGYFHPVLYTVVPLWVFIFGVSSGLYTRPWVGAADRIVLILRGAVLGGLATLTVIYIYDRLLYSRLMFALAVPIVATLVALSEGLVRRLDRWIARFEATSPMLLIGGGRLAEVVHSNVLERHPGLAIFELPRLESVPQALSLARARGVTEVILIPAGNGHERILELAEACESAGISFKMIPDLLELRLGEVQMDDSLGLPAYRIQHTSLSLSNYAVKRAVDLLMSSAVLIVAGAPFAVIAALIKLDSPGPVFYRQRRLGYHGRLFEVFKFRTMKMGAEASLDSVRPKNDQAGGFFKAKEDPRVTRVGRWLRRYSLDEFPQFINVLLGEMSVVGPRPLAEKTGEMESLVRQFGATARKRLNILPGITGLWQVSGRSDVSSQQRFSLDLFYIENWSLGLDLEIILKTVPAMLSAKGAY